MSEEYAVEGNVLVTSFGRSRASIFGRAWFLVSAIPRYLLTGEIKAP